MAADSKLVQDWINYMLAPKDSEEKEALFSAFDTVYELVREQPGDAWEFILGVLAANAETPIVEVLAAGPLEDLLARHGSAVIEQVEREARVNPKFASLLGGVWKNTMNDDVWARVRAVWDRKGWDGIPAV